MQSVLRAGDSNTITFAQATEALAREVRSHSAFRRAVKPHRPEGHDAGAQW